MSAAAEASGAIVPRDGSTLYYSLLWTEPATRARFLDRLALAQALARTLEEVREPSVAERKVHWWHEEIERLVTGAPRHPRTRACRDALGGVAAARAPCLDLLSTAAHLRYAPPATEADFRHELLRAYGARLALLAHALSGREEDLHAPGPRHAELAFGLGLHAALARLPTLLNRGFAVFSDARYARHAVTPIELARHLRRSPEARRAAAAAGGGDGSGGSAPPTGTLGGIPLVVDPPARGALLAGAVAEACAALEAALADPAYRDTYARPELAPIARLAALRRHQLRRWRARRPDLLRERPTATPLVKFLVAWRHRRGAR